VKTNFSLGCSSHEIVRSQIPRGVSKESSRVHMPGLRGEDFDLFRAVVTAKLLVASVRD